MNTKQVIVVRSDLKVHKGKMCSQAAHGSMMFLTRRLQQFTDASRGLTEEQWSWIRGDFTKITLRVDSLDQLLEVYNNAKDAGLEVHLVEDNGTTEFGGVKTATCVAIGPHAVEKIDPITKELRLY